MSENGITVITANKTVFRLYHETRGGHVHCRLFSGKCDGTLGKNGNLCFRVDEFDDFVKKFAFIELRPEHKDRHASGYDRRTEAKAK